MAFLPVFLGFPGGSVGKESAHSAGDRGSIPGLGRSSGRGPGNPLQYILPGESPWIEECHGLQSVGLQRVNSRSKRLLISWLQSLSADKNKIL